MSLKLLRRGSKLRTVVAGGAIARDISEPEQGRRYGRLKHASAEALESIAPLLAEIRAVSGLREKKMGVFYRKSRAFLHFHEEEDRLYADVRLQEPDFQRMPVNESKERKALLKAIREMSDE